MGAVQGASGCSIARMLCSCGGSPVPPLSCWQQHNVVPSPPLDTCNALLPVQHPASPAEPGISAHLGPLRRQLQPGQR